MRDIFAMNRHGGALVMAAYWDEEPLNEEVASKMVQQDFINNRDILYDYVFLRRLCTHSNWICVRFATYHHINSFTRYRRFQPSLLLPGTVEVKSCFDYLHHVLITFIILKCELCTPIARRGRKILIKFDGSVKNRLLENILALIRRE